MSSRIAPLLTSKVMMKKMPGLKRFGEQISTRLLQESLVQNKETKGDLVCTQPREEGGLPKCVHSTCVCSNNDIMQGGGGRWLKIPQNLRAY